MGQDLMNPPTVEGWHTGREWIDSGTLVERINFAAELLGNTELDGVRGLVDRLMARGDTMSPEQFVDGCLEMTGPVQVTSDTHAQLVAHASQEGDLSHGSDDDRAHFHPPHRGNVPDDRRHRRVPSSSNHRLSPIPSP